jgi:hypothetical protein
LANRTTRGNDGLPVWRRCGRLKRRQLFGSAASLVRRSAAAVSFVALRPRSKIRDPADVRQRAARSLTRAGRGDRELSPRRSPQLVKFTSNIKLDDLDGRRTRATAAPNE